MKKTHSVAEYIRPYFYNYLSKTKGLSVHTILSYRDALKLVLRFAADDLKKHSDRLTIEDLDEKLILVFLDYMEKMNELDTNNVEPMAHCLPVSNVFREDRVRQSLGTEKTLANAPQRDKEFFKVPKILEDSSGA